LGTSDDRTDRGTDLSVTRYLAPELIEGGDVCEATDLYAVGAILFEALTGKPPFPGSNPVLVRFAQLQAPPPRPSQHGVVLPPEIDDAVVRALAKEPGQRFANAAEMAESFVRDDVAIKVERVVDQTTVRVSIPSTPSVAPMPATPIEAVVASPPIELPPPRQRRRKAAAGWLWPMVAAVGAIALLIAGLTISLAGDPEIEEMVAGVSTFEPAATQIPGNSSNAAVDASATPTASPTPTVRVVRQSTADDSDPTPRPRRRRTPTPTDEE
jgi:serine/threonine-protein kinase